MERVVRKRSVGGFGREVVVVIEVCRGAVQRGGKGRVRPDVEERVLVVVGHHLVGVGEVSVAGGEWRGREGRTTKAVLVDVERGEGVGDGVLKYGREVRRSLRLGVVVLVTQMAEGGRVIAVGGLGVSIRGG